MDHLDLGQSEPDRSLLDIEALARRLRCSTRHVHRLLRVGRIPPPRRLGTLIRWDPIEIDEWIRRGCPASVAEAVPGRHTRDV